jgi:hypothetical protein
LLRHQRDFPLRLEVRPRRLGITKSTRAPPRELAYETKEAVIAEGQRPESGHPACSQTGCGTQQSNLQPENTLRSFEAGEASGQSEIRREEKVRPAKGSHAEEESGAGHRDPPGRAKGVAGGEQEDCAPETGTKDLPHCEEEGRFAIQAGVPAKDEATSQEIAGRPAS